MMRNYHGIKILNSNTGRRQERNDHNPEEIDFQLELHSQPNYKLSLRVEQQHFQTCKTSADPWPMSSQCIGANERKNDRM